MSEDANNHETPPINPTCAGCGKVFFDRAMPVPGPTLRELLKAYGWAVSPKTVCGPCRLEGIDGDDDGDGAGDED